MLLDPRDMQLYWCGKCNTGNLMQNEVAIIGVDKKTTICKECKTNESAKKSSTEVQKS